MSLYLRIELVPGPTVGGVTEPDLGAEWWTTSDVATYIGVSVTTVSSYRARGQMPAPDQTLGRTRLWRPKRIIDWHQSRPGHGGRRANQAHTRARDTDVPPADS